MTAALGCAVGTWRPLFCDLGSGQETKAFPVLVICIPILSNIFNTEHLLLM